MLFRSKTYEGAQLAFTALAGIPYIGPALGLAAAAAAIVAGLARVSMIGSQEMPSYDQGGVNTSPGFFYSGVPEAHIPLKSGAVPVEINMPETQQLPPIYITVEIDGQALGETIYDQTKDGHQIIHTRGITSI